MLLEIYSDPDSKAQKYRRLLAYLTIFLPIMIVVASRGHEAPFFVGIQAVYAVMLGVYIFAVVNLIGRIRKLRHV